MYAAGQPIVVDHINTRLSDITLQSINKAKTDLHIAYGHTSHGSQLIDGMTGLTTFGGAPQPGSNYAWSDGPKAGAMDIDDYNPDGVYFGDKRVDDACDYTGGNWCTEWQNTHTKGVYWYDSVSAHSQPLNANLKAYAAWYLWARLAGAGTPVTTLKADFSKNGLVDSEDFKILKDNWVRTSADS